MSTRSTISIETPEGIRSIYCHYDGYLEHIGSILKEHYNTADKVNELIDLGDLSSLGKDLENTIAYHRDRKKPLSILQLSFFIKDLENTIAYHRDRKEPLSIEQLSFFIKDLENTIAYHRDRKESLRIEQVSFLGDISAQDYNYVFKDGVWSYWRESHHFSSMKEV